MKTQKLLVIVAISCVMFGLSAAGVVENAQAGPRETILEVLLRTDGAQALLAAVETAEEAGCLGGISDALADKKAELVVFAPSNAAFEKLFRLTPNTLAGRRIDEIKDDLQGLLNSIALDENDLCGLLQKHVAIGTKKPKDSSVQELLARGEITVADGSVFPISVGQGDVTVNYESEVSVRDVFAKNGVIHYLAEVLSGDLPAPPPGGDVVRVFVTDGVELGRNLGGLAGADALCQAQAEDAGLAGTWTAWLSTTDEPGPGGSPGVDARDRVPDGQYQLLDGTVIADGKDDLTDGFLNAPINLNQFGDEEAGGLVWTGTRPNGTAEADTCGNWEADERGVPGSLAARNPEWTSATAGTPCNTQFLRLYCFGGGE